MTKMIKIQINEATHKRLKSHAEPLEDSYDTVINRALDALEPRKAPIDKKKIDRNIIILDPNHFPNLTHTKILSATVNGNQMSRPHLNWSWIRNELIRIAMQQYHEDINWLRSKSSTDIIEGYTQYDKYEYIQDLDISVAWTNTKKTSQALVNIALALSVPVKLTLKWRTNKKGAAYPGEIAILKVSKGKVTINREGLEHEVVVNRNTLGTEK